MRESVRFSARRSGGSIRPARCTRSWPRCPRRFAGKGRPRGELPDRVSRRPDSTAAVRPRARPHVHRHRRAWDGTRSCPRRAARAAGATRRKAVADGPARRIRGARVIVRGRRRPGAVEDVLDCHVPGMPAWDVGVDIDTGAPPSIAAQMIVSGQISAARRAAARARRSFGALLPRAPPARDADHRAAPSLAGLVQSPPFTGRRSGKVGCMPHKMWIANTWADADGRRDARRRSIRPMARCSRACRRRPPTMCGRRSAAARTRVRRGAVAATGGPRSRHRALPHRGGDPRAGAPQFAELDTRNMGKPIVEAEFDVSDAAHCFEYYGGHGDEDPWRDARSARQRAVDGRARASRRRRPDHPVELSAADGRVEAGAGAGRRLHGGAETSRADAAVCARCSPRFSNRWTCRQAS